ncbi:nucleotide sugar dehydrogenase [Candidatus Pelagibacter sp.]|uniref:nucleotide sugar dehydrogenase n=1 Tax=Candidatus Pelagibacter sp. TaxID=2024849 RepID=UPI003F83591C
MKKIVIQGLGYVGLAMMTFCAGAQKKNKYLYNVVGIEKNSKKGLKIIKEINSNQTPKIVDDKKFINFYSRLKKKNRIKASINTDEYLNADIVFVCSNCDYNFSKSKVDIKNYIKNIKQISKKIKNNCLIIIQSTLPPGTTEKILEPLIKKNLSKRGIKNFYLCHSFERITPGRDYYSSMKNVERIIGGRNKKSLIITKKIFRDIFKLELNKVIEFSSPSESETCKIIENSYRALNIAFIEEWRKFCSKNNLDLEKILSCIRQRKTHSNIMRSGIGVGGYCLTKDPLFARSSSKQILRKKFNFTLSSEAVKINKKMTFDVMSEIKSKFSKKIINKKVLLIGVSYREDTNDTRHSPAENVFNFLKKIKCKLSFYDPIVNYWKYNNNQSIEKKDLKKFDVYIHLVKHKCFENLNIQYKKKSLILDLNHVLDEKKKSKLSNNKNYEYYCLGSKQL